MRIYNIILKIILYILISYIVYYENEAVYAISAHTSPDLLNRYKNIFNSIFYEPILKYNNRLMQNVYSFLFLILSIPILAQGYEYEIPTTCTSVEVGN